MKTNQLIDFFKLAVKNLQHRKLRSWLTMIGIFIGIAAVVSLISLGRGMQQSITEQFEKAGSNVISIMGSSGGLSSPFVSLISSKPLTTKDVKQIEKVKGVDQVAGTLATTASIAFRGETKTMFVWGMDPGPTKEIIKKSEGYTILKGRDLRPGDDDKVLLGYDVGFKLFKHEINPGDKLLINEKSFKVVGVVSKVGNRFDDQAVMVPLKTLQDLINEKEKLSMIFLSVKQGFGVNKVADDIGDRLRKFRNEEEGSETFQVSTPKDLLRVFSSILLIVQAVLIGIAAISLLVGGIGIMNTMYMAVLERTKEIGIMKAIGAKNNHVMIIFLIESGLLGTFGGVIGVAIGLSISKGVEVIVKSITGTPLISAYISWWLVLFAIAFSFVIGVFSGLMPARQAASLNPAETLRYE